MNTIKYNKAKKKALQAHGVSMLLSSICWFDLGIEPAGLSDKTMIAIIREKEAYVSRQ